MVPTTLFSRRVVIAAFASVAVLAASLLFADWWSCLPPETTAHFVGRQSCVQCHSQQASLWEGSHHDLAMDLATPETVLGDFNDAEVTHHGITSKMYRRDGQFLVRTEGPDGELAEFQVKYVFGVEPLQQYMVEFDRPAEMPEHEIARLQVLRISWDTERQQWFYLNPPDVAEKLAPNDDLHWTGIAQRWNNMCADCHSTNLQKNFDAKSKIYHTTYSEIDVSCEACHGPGSTHVGLAESRSFFWDRQLGYGLARLKDSDTNKEIHTCARCHSRRRVFSSHFMPGDDFYDHYANELLQAHTYHDDGQILDEVYVFGSFIQSKMYHKSIRCTDCHDPHTARLKHNGNQVCTSCHQHSAGKYDHPTHHRHNVGSSGAQCVSCHMPETTYMDVDPRRDHSLRVPRPDLSVEAGTPNACTGCHLDRAPLSAERQGSLDEYADWLAAARAGDEEIADALRVVDQWAAESFVEWYGKKDDVETHFANVLSKARRNPAAIETRNALLEIAKDPRQTPIVRATSLLELGHSATAKTARDALPLLKEDDPQVRMSALELMQLLPDADLVKHGAPLLQDPVRSVRAEAGRILARVPREQLRGPQRHALRAAIKELERGLLLNNDRAAAHMTLGIIYESQRDLPLARQAYETAIHVEPASTGPRSNLAALFDRQLEEAQQQLRSNPNGVSTEFLRELVGMQREASRLRREELDLLARDSKLAPDNAPIQYRYGLSLYLHNRLDDAEQALEKAVALEPQTADFVLALALLYQKRGRLAEALQLTEDLVALRPDDESYRRLLAEMRMESRAVRSE